MNAVILIGLFFAPCSDLDCNESSRLVLRSQRRTKVCQRRIQKTPWTLSSQMHMQMLTKRKKVIEISEKIDKSLFEYYSELGKPVPKWRLKKILTGGQGISMI